MKELWTRGLDSDQAKDVVGDFKSSHLLRKRMVDILESKVESEERARGNKSSYDNPNWPLLQADLVGYKKAIRDVIDLLSEK